MRASRDPTRVQNGDLRPKVSQQLQELGRSSRLAHARRREAGTRSHAARAAEDGYRVTEVVDAINAGSQKENGADAKLCQSRAKAVLGSEPLHRKGSRTGEGGARGGAETEWRKWSRSEDKPPEVHATTTGPGRMNLKAARPAIAWKS